MRFLVGRNRNHQGKEATVVKSTRTLSSSTLGLMLVLSGALQAQVRVSVPCYAYNNYYLKLLYT